VAARAVDTVSEPEKCLFRGMPYQYAFLEKDNLLLTCNGGGVYAYDVVSGEQRWHRYLVSTQGYQGASFDGRQVLIWMDGGVALLDAANGKEIWSRRDVPCGQIFQAQLSPDGRRVMVVGERSCVLLGITERTQRSLPTMSGFQGWFSGGKTVMFASFERRGGGMDGSNGAEIRKWQIMDVDTGTITPCWEEPNSRDTPWPSFSSLGQFAEVTEAGEKKGTLRITDARTHAAIHEFKDLGDLGRYVSWMKEGKRLYFVTADRKEFRVIEAETGAVQVVLSGEGHLFNVGGIFEDGDGGAWAFSKDGANHRYAWKLVPDGTPRKVLDGARIAPARFYLDRATAGRLLTMNMEEDLLWVYGVYDLASMSKVAEWRCRSAERMWGGFTVNNALTHVVASYPVNRNDYGRPQNMMFNLYAKDREMPVRTGRGNVLAISPDARYMALQTDDQMACLYDAEADRIVGQYATSGKEKGQRNMTAVFSDDGKRLALNTAESVEITDLSGDYPRRTMASGDKQSWWLTLRFSPDGNCLLCGGNNRAWLCNAASGALLHTFEETERFADLYHYVNGGFWSTLTQAAKDWAGMVTDSFKQGTHLDVAFDEGGSRVVTHTAGQIIRVWDAESGRMLHAIHTSMPEKRNFRGEIRNTVALSANGRFAFVYNGDGFGPAALWSVTDGILLRRYRLPQCSWLSATPQEDGKAVFVISNMDLYRWPGAPLDMQPGIQH
jgi:WD40 repeat protein